MDTPSFKILTDDKIINKKFTVSSKLNFKRARPNIDLKTWVQGIFFHNIAHHIYIKQLRKDRHVCLTPDTDHHYGVTVSTFLFH